MIGYRMNVLRNASLKARELPTTAEAANIGVPQRREQIRRGSVLDQVSSPCGGEGGYEKHIRVYEHGCGFAHDDCTWATCQTCGGRGINIIDVEPNA
jgi:hypothetical protein